MLFVDGENLTIRAQELAEQQNIKFPAGKAYSKDVFIWMPATRATDPFMFREPMRTDQPAIRAHYYTQVKGASPLKSVRLRLRALGFQPEVFVKPDKTRKAKGVDIALTKDVLSHAFRDNYDTAVLIAGDGDYVPLVEEVKRLGKVVCVAFFTDPGLGLNEKLHVASDILFDMKKYFLHQWRHAKKGT